MWPTGVKDSRPPNLNYFEKKNVLFYLLKFDSFIIHAWKSLETLNILETISIQRMSKHYWRSVWHQNIFIKAEYSKKAIFNLFSKRLLVLGRMTRRHAHLWGYYISLRASFMHYVLHNVNKLFTKDTILQIDPQKLIKTHCNIE